MRSNENKERIEGYLYGLDDGNGRDALAKRQSGANSKNPGTDYIAGTILVAVDETIPATLSCSRLEKETSLTLSKL